MSKQTYPQYKLQTWIDTGPEAFSKPDAQVTFGIDVKQEKGGQWFHLASGGKALFFDTSDKAWAKILELRKSARAAISKATGSPIGVDK